MEMSFFDNLEKYKSSVDFKGITIYDIPYSITIDIINNILKLSKNISEFAS